MFEDIVLNNWAAEIDMIDFGTEQFLYFFSRDSTNDGHDWIFGYWKLVWEESLQTRLARGACKSVSTSSRSDECQKTDPNPSSIIDNLATSFQYEYRAGSIKSMFNKNTAPPSKSKYNQESYTWLDKSIAPRSESKSNLPTLAPIYGNFLLCG